MVPFANQDGASPSHGGALSPCIGWALAPAELGRRRLRPAVGLVAPGRQDRLEAMVRRDPPAPRVATAAVPPPTMVRPGRRRVAAIRTRSRNGARLCAPFSLLFAPLPGSGFFPPKPLLEPVTVEQVEQDVRVTCSAWSSPIKEEAVCRRYLRGEARGATLGGGVRAWRRNKGLRRIRLCASKALRQTPTWRAFRIQLPRPRHCFMWPYARLFRAPSWKTGP